MNQIEKSDNTYQGLVDQISEIYTQGQQQAVIAVNTHLVDTYWKVGQYIMRQFYSAYPIFAEVPQKLSWTHWVELLKIDDPLERSFYLNQAAYESWSTTELIRQKKSSLYLRLASSKGKEGILQLARQGQKVEKPGDIIREPYVLDFLQIPEPYHLSESDLESRIISKLQSFLLELGRGFAFIGRQYRIVLGNPPALCRFGILPPHP